ncbi:MAG TPA: arsenic transporter [Caldimonas sp.]|nr:arsenic transporter [Caldimonas sp.]
MTPPHLSFEHAGIWAVAAVATAGVIVRPWRIPEAVWAVCGAVLLVATGLVPWASAQSAVARGRDVYLFLAGMMLLAEIARREGLFEWLAVVAVRHARGSARRLFALVYAIGTLVTVLMSNDATAVVLTPAVCAVVRRAGAKPLPYLLVCAFIANAASFVLPISNPANLVVFGAGLPDLVHWLARFTWPSVAAIVATYAVLVARHRRELGAPLAAHVPEMPLATGARLAGVGILIVAAVLLVFSALDRPLGTPTLIASLVVAALVAARTRAAPWPALRGVAWSVLVLVAGLFVLVEGFVRSGVVDTLVAAVHAAAAASTSATAFGVGALVAFACNALNNLPAGLLAGSVVQQAAVAPAIQGAVAVGIDLGPNLSVTGSLATILWLIAIRREGESVSAMQFLREGAVVMPVALVLSLLALLVLPGV